MTFRRNVVSQSSFHVEDGSYTFILMLSYTKVLYKHAVSSSFFPEDRATHSSETSINIYQNAPCPISEASDLQLSYFCQSHRKRWALRLYTVPCGLALCRHH